MTNERNLRNIIKNETITKMNRDEIGVLGLYGEGIMTFKGDLKSKRRGFKTEIVNDWQTNFESEGIRVEVIRIEQTLPEKEYAIRMFDKTRGEYMKHWNIMAGIDFFR